MRWVDIVCGPGPAARPRPERPGERSEQEREAERSEQEREAERSEQEREATSLEGVNYRIRSRSSAVSSMSHRSLQSEQRKATMSPGSKPSSGGYEIR